MPELPEVEGIRRVLSSRLIGLSVLSVDVSRVDVIKPLKGSRKTPGRSGRGQALLEGGVFNGIIRHGKRLALIVDDGRILEFGLGMSGQLSYIPLSRGWKRQKHEHVSWELGTPESGISGWLVWRDPRRFGGITPVPGRLQLEEHQWKALGPDATKISRTAFHDRLKGGRSSVEVRLLDQKVIAGVGNIYADEALFDSGINPKRAANRISSSRLERLRGSIQAILREAIRAGGSSIRTYKDPDGRNGSFQNAHAVYGRQNEGCVRCGALIRSKPLGGRTTTWCPHCQT